ncbi:hypothetical protein FACS1894113_4560 [Alphaproteobacteria bacterium]|nr:hypothetical protein FACS1894113_4560 [Alphaproteobacteria bacterium]
MKYDSNNVFYKIINKELKSNILLESDHFIAINDIAPKAPVHVLAISKGLYVDYYEFVSKASDEEILDFNKGILKIIEMFKLTEDGYRLVSNSGRFGMQEVMHFHMHIMGKSSDS